MFLKEEAKEKLRKTEKTTVTLLFFLNIKFIVLINVSWL